jgi:hypothetical protein
MRGGADHSPRSAAELRERHLRFSPEEAAELVRTAVGPVLPAVTVAVLEDRAQGLVAGLHRRRYQFRVMLALPPSSRALRQPPACAGLPSRAAMDIPAPGVGPTSSQTSPVVESLVVLGFVLQGLDSVIRELR